MSMPPVDRYHATGVPATWPAATGVNAIKDSPAMDLTAQVSQFHADGTIRQNLAVSNSKVRRSEFLEQRSLSPNVHLRQANILCMGITLLGI